MNKYEISSGNFWKLLCRTIPEANNRSAVGLLLALGRARYAYAYTYSGEEKARRSQMNYEFNIIIISGSSSQKPLNNHACKMYMEVFSVHIIVVAA